MLEVLREDAIELDDGLGRLALGHQRLAHQELRAGRDVGARVRLQDRAQRGQRGIDRARQVHGARGAQLGLGLDAGIGHLGGDAREFLRGALEVPRGQERVRLPEQGVVAQRRIGVALRHLLERGRRLEARALRVEAQRLQIRGGRAVRLRSQQRQRVGRLPGQVGDGGARQHQARIPLHPRSACARGRQQLARRGNVAATHRVPGLPEPRGRDQRTLRETPLPLRPFPRGVGVAARGFERLDGGQGRVVGERSLAVAYRFVERLRGLGVVSELVVEGSGEESGRITVVGIHATTHDLRHGLLSLLERGHTVGLRQESVLFEGIAYLLK